MAQNHENATSAIVTAVYTVNYKVQ